MKYGYKTFIVVLAAMAIFVAFGPVVSAAGQDGWKLDGETMVYDKKAQLSVIHTATATNETQNITVTSKLMHYLMDDAIFKFIEEAHIVQDNTSVDADSGIFKRNDNSGDLKGNVLMNMTPEEPDGDTIILTCEHLVMDTDTNSFTAEGQPVMKLVSPDGKETVVVAKKIEYDGNTKVATMTGDKRGDVDITTEDMRVLALKAVINTDTQNYEFEQFVMNLLDNAEESQ